LREGRTVEREVFKVKSVEEERQGGIILRWEIGLKWRENDKAERRDGEKNMKGYLRLW
jgi:hypothetical protein